MREQFLQEIASGNIKTMPADAFMRYWKKLTDAECATGLSMDDPLSRRDYVRLLSHTLVRRVRTFYTHREPLQAYVAFLEQNGALPAGQTGIVRSFGFEDLDCTGMRDRLYYTSVSAMLAAVDAAIENAATPFDDVFDPAVAILILAWYGLSCDRIAEVLKSDVTDDGVIVDGTLVPMPPFCMARLHRYRDAQGVYSQGRGLIFRRYKPSAYLLRSIGAARADRFIVRRTVNRLNVFADETRPLTHDIVCQSGIYSRVMAAELAGVKVDEQLGLAEAQQLFCCPIPNETQLRFELLDYRHYKKMFCSL